MPVKPKFFKTQFLFRKWLEKNHLTKQELVVGFYTIKSGKSSMTWSQSVDEALCFGWIDSVRHNIDAESYSIRFTPRKSTSIWSKVNIRKMNELKAKGLLLPRGIEVFANRDKNRSGIYSHENPLVKLSSSFEKKFKMNKKAWLFFSVQTRSYQRAAATYVMSAKQEATREKRLAELIKDSFAESKIRPLSYGKKK